MAGARNPADRIEAALRKLKVRPEKMAQLPGLVHVFAGLVGKVNVKTPAKFSPAGLARSKQELRTIAKHAAALRAAMRSAHAPAIVALADHGALWNKPTEDWLILLAYAARKGKPNAPRKPQRGRPAKAGATAVALLAAGAYRNLTGEEPSVPTDAMRGKPYGPFFKFVAALFSILKVDASAEGAARKVCEQIKRRKIANSP